MVHRYEPLRECDFSHKIQLCYFSAKEFYCELSMEETLQIYKLFEDNKRQGFDSSGHNVVLVGSPVGSRLLGSQMKSGPVGGGNTSSAQQSLEGYSKGKISGISDGWFDVPGTQGSTDFPRQPIPRGATHSTGLPFMGYDSNRSSGGELLGTGFDSNQFLSGARSKGEIQSVLPCTDVIQFNSAMPPSTSEHLMESLPSSMNCSPTVRGNDAETCKNAVVTQQMAVCLGNNGNDRLSGQPLQVVIQTQTGVGSPLRPEINDGLAQETHRLKDEVQNLKREVEGLKSDNARIREMEAISRQRAENDQAFLRSQIELGRNASNELHKVKCEELRNAETTKSLRRELQAVKDELQRKEDEIMVVRNDLHAAHRVQHNLLKIQDDYMGALERNERERKDLSSRLEELSCENKKLKGTLESHQSTFLTPKQKFEGK